MSRHIPRKDRWDSHGPNEYRSIEGFAVRYEKGSWWAYLAIEYRIDGDESLPVWERRRQRLGPFKRPRNAMVEAEREAIALRNRHGERIRFESA